MWKNKTDLFFLINQPIFHISYLFISSFCLFMCLLRRDNMVYKDLTGTQVGEVDLHFTFWPKEGSIAWFVAVGPSVMLQEKEKNTMTYGWNKLIQHPYKGQKNIYWRKRENWAWHFWEVIFLTLLSDVTFLILVFYLGVWKDGVTISKNGADSCSFPPFTSLLPNDDVTVTGYFDDSGRIQATGLCW